LSSLVQIEGVLFIFAMLDPQFHSYFSAAFIYLAMQQRQTQKYWLSVQQTQCSYALHAWTLVQITFNSQYENNIIRPLKYIIYMYIVSKKTVQNSFCQNFVKFPPTVKIFDTKNWKEDKLQWCTHFPPHLICQRTTPLPQMCQNIHSHDKVLTKIILHRFFETRYRATSVAAPDHKIRQCIQRSALFPKYADGGSKGPKQGSGGAKRWSADGVGLG